MIEEVQPGFTRCSGQLKNMGHEKMPEVFDLYFLKGPKERDDVIRIALSGILLYFTKTRRGLLAHTKEIRTRESGNAPRKSEVQGDSGCE